MTTATPTPTPDPDTLSDLGDRIAVLAAHIHAATHELLMLVAEFDRLRGWEPEGHRSCAHWLAYRTGIELGAAREKLRTARALTWLPLTSAAMARGELSFSKARALTRVATPDNEADLVELACGCTVAQLERIVRAWKLHDRVDEAELERERHERRALAVFPGDDGMYVVRGRLDAETGALLMRALEAASDALWREQGSPVPESDEARRRAAAQRRADAIGLLAERALDGGRVSGARAERYQVVLHVDQGTLSEDGDPGRSHLEDGTRVSAETSRRVCCDASVVEVGHDSGGSVLDVGRRTRTIPPALRRALEVRDGGCRFPTPRLRRAVPAGSASPTRTTCVTGPTAARPRSPTACCCAASITGWCTSRAGRSSGGARAGRRSSTRTARRTSTAAGSRPRSATSRSTRSSRATEPTASQPDWRTASARWKRAADIPDHVYLDALEAIA